MSRTDGKWGKRILSLAVAGLFLAALCLLALIAASLPARTEQIYGPADPLLSTEKLYRQSFTLLLQGEGLQSPVNPGVGAVRVPVESGDSLDLILNRLVELGLVRHPVPFRAYLIYAGIDTRIQTGEYSITGDMSELEIARVLGSPAPAQTTVSILAGWRAEEIASTFPALGLGADPEAFLLAVQVGEREGYLFPGNYQVDRDIPPQGLVDLFYQQFLTQISADLEAQLQSQGLSVHQAVILASLIEREAVIDEEMPQIASVFLNRLQAGMNLASDPSIQYALGYNQEQATWWTNPLSLEDLKLPSSYNTYENPGLPPGPICNPGLSALQAVAQPAQTAFLYFRAACDGSGRHLFAESFEEHLQNACP